MSMFRSTLGRVMSPRASPSGTAAPERSRHAIVRRCNMSRADKSDAEHGQQRNLPDAPLQDMGQKHDTHVTGEMDDPGHTGNKADQTRWPETPSGIPWSRPPGAPRLRAGPDTRSAVPPRSRKLAEQSQTAGSRPARPQGWRSDCAWLMYCRGHQGDSVDGPEVGDHQHDLQAVEIHRRLHGGLLERSAGSSADVHNLADDQVGRKAAAQAGGQHQIAWLDIHVLRD